MFDQALNTHLLKYSTVWEKILYITGFYLDNIVLVDLLLLTFVFKLSEISRDLVLEILQAP